MFKRRRIRNCSLFVILTFVLVYWWTVTQSVAVNDNVVYTERREIRHTAATPSTVALNEIWTAIGTSQGPLLPDSRHINNSEGLNSSSKRREECAPIWFDFRDNSRTLLAPVKSIDANCHSLFAGNLGYARSIRRQLKSWKHSQTDTAFMHSLTTNCNKTKTDFYNSFYISESEKAFPLAFEFPIYYKPFRVQQYVRLLKYLYRPHNVYCIHIDGKAPDWWTNELISFAECFPNIIIAKNRINVDYGTAKILYAHFSCFTELLASQYNWQYLITLHGTELPLVTNGEMIRELRQMNGTNIIQRGEDSTDKSSQSHEWITYKVKSIAEGKKIVLTNQTLGPIPYNMTVYKSAASANSAMSRAFVSFLFTDNKSIALASFLKDVQSAVELFFSTVNSLPNAPGGYYSYHGNITDMPLIAKRDWVFRRKTFKEYCMARKLVHNICIVSCADLARLSDASQQKSWWFHNKYFQDYDHVVMNCMETLLLERNSKEYQHDCL